ncbi:MAG: STAS domain-containing protein [Leptospiraceae bacterium]|nr:STAS domain-containing protein [Leptospiraceae bacterium]
MKEEIEFEDITNESENLIQAHDITEEDILLIKNAGEELVDELPKLLDSFYAWLKTTPEFEIFFSDPGLLKEVVKLQQKYWMDFFTRPIDNDYIESRKRIGMAHARIGLSLTIFFAGVSKFHSTFSEIIQKLKTKNKPFETLIAFTRRLHLDTTIIVDTFNTLTNEKIADQNRALMEMSTPVTAIWDGILMLPIVGVMDSKRTQDIMDSILYKISQTQAVVTVIDISGVAVVDTAVANHLIKITKATKLMGCETIISGISPEISRTIVELGIDVGSIITTSTLRHALRTALKKVGLSVKENVPKY